MSDKKILSTAEAAAMLGVTQRTIQRWYEAGELPGAYQLNPNIEGSPILVPLETVQQILSARRQQK